MTTPDPTSYDFTWGDIAILYKRAYTMKPHRDPARFIARCAGVDESTAKSWIRTATDKGVIER